MALHRPHRRHINQLRAKIDEIGPDPRPIAASGGKDGLTKWMPRALRLSTVSSSSRSERPRRSSLVTHRRSPGRPAATRSGDGFRDSETHRSGLVSRSSGKTARYWQGNGLQNRLHNARRGSCALNVILDTNLPMTPDGVARGPGRGFCSGALHSHTRTLAHQRHERGRGAFADTLRHRRRGGRLSALRRAAGSRSGRARATWLQVRGQAPAPGGRILARGRDLSLPP